MKNLFAYLSITTLLFLNGCSENYSLDGEAIDIVSRVPIQLVANMNPPSLINQRKIMDQLVVKFVPGLTDMAKENLRSYYRVKEIKTCSCADETLELWTIDLEDLDGGLEEIKGEISTNPDLEGVDYQFLFQQVADSGNLVQSDHGDLLNLVKDHNDGVTVAIIDSGIDFNHVGFTSPLLYNSQESDDYCTQDDQSEISGWDFVNGDNIAEDGFGHGTIVADIIEEVLSEEDIAYQILPVKSFDGKGKGTYFDILCGFIFASQKADVDIINMSFGWYAEPFEILPTYIEEVAASVLVITSSGNQGVDVDNYSHFPSGYTYQNILSVAGIDSLDQSLAYFSNYGFSSVDMVAASHSLSFTTDTGTTFVSGTSYANAHASAEAVLLFDPSNTPVDQIDIMVDNAQFNIELEGKTKYPKMIMH